MDDELTIDQVDAWVRSRLAESVVGDIKQLEVDHFAVFMKEYGRFVEQFEVQYSALVEALEAANFVDRTNWPQHRYVQFALLSYNVKTFHSAFDRIVRGYYEDGIALTRGLYEAFVRTLFVSCFPDDAYSALITNAPKGMRRFNLTNFLDHDLGLQWETKYAVTSPFAHSNSLETFQALKRAIDRVGEPEVFGFRLAFDERLAEASIPLLNFVLLTHMRFVLEQLLGDDTDVDEDLLAGIRESVRLLAHQIETHDSEYWRTVAADLDLLFEMLDVADERGDWRAFLASRRAAPPAG